MTQLARKGASVVLWEKGSKKRETFISKQYFSEHKRLLCSFGKSSSMIGKKILFTFELSGLSFFGTAETKSTGEGEAALDIVGELYKSERRSTFRLLTYPHHKVFLNFSLAEEQAEAGNVIGFKSGHSQTGLFKSFLTLINEGGSGEGDDSEAQGMTAFRVLDLSVTGAAMHVGELEAKAFPEGAKTGKIFLDFNGTREAIPNGEIVYNVRLVSGNPAKRIYKVGVKFLEMDTNTDSKLGTLINSALRGFESEFEDFIK